MSLFLFDGICQSELSRSLLSIDTLAFLAGGYQRSARSGSSSRTGGYVGRTGKTLATCLHDQDFFQRQSPNFIVHRRGIGAWPEIVWYQVGSSRRVAPWVFLPSRRGVAPYICEDAD